MTSKLEHPATSPTTTITFDSVLKWQPTRQVEKMLKRGDLQGNGVVESAGISMLSMKLTVAFKSDSGGDSALTKYWDFDTLIKDNNDDSMRLTVDVGGSTKIFDGKIESLTSDWNMGEPDLVTCSFTFFVESIVS